MILIIGATGKLGNVVAHALLKEGKAIRAMTRTPEKAAMLKESGAEIVVGDLRDPHSLALACREIDKIFAASHSFDGKGKNSPQVVDGIGNQNLATAAKSAGVQHIVFTSVQGASPDSPVDFFRIKYEAEQYIINSGVEYTILRPAAFMDSWADIIGKPILEKGKATIFGRGKNPVNLVAVADVAQFALLALDDPAARNQVLDIGGPENLTIEQVVEMFERLSGKNAKRNYVPLPLMRVMKSILRPFNPVLSRMIAAGINMDTADNSLDMTAMLKRFPLQLTSLETYLNTHYRHD